MMNEEHVPADDHDAEVQSEQTYVDGLYARLDAERARVRDRYRTALREHGGTAVERDAEVRALAKEANRLDVADNGLCFGRLEPHLGAGRFGLPQPAYPA